MIARFVRLTLFLLLIGPLCMSVSAQQKKLTAIEARQHIGQFVTVCGIVVSARYAESTKGQPTFLNLDKPYPNQIFTVLIWGSDRYKFGEPDKSLKGKNICVTGKVTEYRGVPEIVTSTTEQIQSEVKIKEP
jgi:DNA/RNA endonuclease YhcR with UshA esterase domain